MMWLKKVRKVLGITQYELSRITGIPRWRIVVLEAGIEAARAQEKEILEDFRNATRAQVENHMALFGGFFRKSIK
jgi:predicted transcriptional regulator